MLHFTRRGGEVDGGSCRLGGLFGVCRSWGGYNDEVLYFILHFAAGNGLETLSFPSGSRWATWH
jgi:hypothetical protein